MSYVFVLTTCFCFPLYITTIHICFSLFTLSLPLYMKQTNRRTWNLRWKRGGQGSNNYLYLVESFLIVSRHLPDSNFVKDPRYEDRDRWFHSSDIQETMCRIVHFIFLIHSHNSWGKDIPRNLSKTWRYYLSGIYIRVYINEHG